MDATVIDEDPGGGGESADREIERLRGVLSALRWWSVLPFFVGLIVMPTVFGVAILDQTLGSRSILAMTVALAYWIAGVGAMKFRRALRARNSLSQPTFILMFGLVASALGAFVLIPKLGAPLDRSGYVTIGGMILAMIVAMIGATACCASERRHRRGASDRRSWPETLPVLGVALAACAGGVVIIAGALHPRLQDAIDLAIAGLWIQIVSAVAVGVRLAIEAAIVLITTDRLIHDHDRVVVPRPPRGEDALVWIVQRCASCGYQRGEGTTGSVCSECGTPWMVAGLELLEHRRLNRLRVGACLGVVLVIGTPVLAWLAPCILFLFVPITGLAAAGLVGTATGRSRVGLGVVALGAAVVFGITLPFGAFVFVSGLAIIAVAISALAGAIAVSAWILVCWGEREALRQGDPRPPHWLWVIPGAAFLMPCVALMLETPATIAANTTAASMIGVQVTALAGYAVVGFTVCRIAILLARDIGRHLRSRPLCVGSTPPTSS